MTHQAGASLFEIADKYKDAAKIYKLADMDKSLRAYSNAVMLFGEAGKCRQVSNRYGGGYVTAAWSSQTYVCLP